MEKSYKKWGYLCVDVKQNRSYDVCIPIITDADDTDTDDSVDELDLFDMLDEEEE